MMYLIVLSGQLTVQIMLMEADVDESIFRYI